MVVSPTQRGITIEEARFLFKRVVFVSIYRVLFNTFVRLEGTGRLTVDNCHHGKDRELESIFNLRLVTRHATLVGNVIVKFKEPRQLFMPGTFVFLANN